MSFDIDGQIGNFGPDLQTGIRKLTRPEQEALLREFCHEESQETIGDEMGYTHQHISRLRTSALKKLRNLLI
jgi:DNA-directed RNA polymerase specialized sigma subunit